MYLIDGNNVIGKRLTESESSSDRLRLIGEVSDFARKFGNRCAIIFDGTPEATIQDGSKRQGVTILYARPGRDADHRIIELIERERNRQALRVITSDSQLAAKARAYGVKVISRDEFRQKLREAGSNDGKSEKPSFSKGDMSEWFRYFGVDEDDDGNEYEFEDE